jgi:hypothetical protein
MITKKLYSWNNGDSGILSSGIKESMKSKEEKDIFLINLLPLSFNSSDIKNKELKKEYRKGIKSIGYISSIPGIFLILFFNILKLISVLKKIFFFLIIIL